MHPANISCDVLVVGGGAAGVAAAVAAGRAGAQVVLLERYGYLGGLATAAQVGTICGLYLRDSAGAKPVPVAGGFASEFGSRLQRATGVGPVRVDAGLWVLPFPPDAFARVADAVVNEAGNVKLVLHATVADARAEGRCLVQVRALAWNEPMIVRPGALVDCTGEATTAALAGARIENGVADQAPALVFTLDGVDPDLVRRGLLELRMEVRRGVERGSLPALCESFSLVPGMGSDGRLSFKLTLPAAHSDCPPWQQVTAWEREGRALVDQLQRFLIQTAPACRNARCASIAPQVGVRSGGRIRGRNTLTDRNVLETRKCPCGVARGSWPMERWSHRPKPELTFFKERDYYEITLDCLRSAELDNVLAAGRCVAAELKAMTSVRVIGTALATGWAAGTAAAFEAMGRTVDEAVAVVREQMRE